MLLTALPDRAVDGLDRVRAEARADSRIFDEAAKRVHEAQPTATISSAFVALLLIPDAGRTDDNLQAVVISVADKGLLISGIAALTFVGASWSRTCPLEYRPINAGCLSVSLTSLNASAGPLEERLASKRPIKKSELSMHTFFARPEDFDFTAIADSIAQSGIPWDRLP
ncbi:MAG: hypothetical protein ACLPR9_00015 [Acidimicrobiales bacterium]